MFKNREFIKVYAAGLTLGLLGGIFIYLNQPVKWEAKALVGLAKTYQPLKIDVSQTQSQAPSGFDIIEGMPIVLERLRSPSFLATAAKRDADNKVLDSLNNGNCSCVNAKPLKNNEALIISIAGESSELSKNSLSAVVAELKYRHSILLEKYKDGVEAKALVKDQEADALSSELIALTNRIRTEKTNMNQAIKDGMLVMIMEASLEKKLNKSIQIRDLTSTFSIRQTELLEPIWVTKKILFSSLLSASMFGMLSGLFLSLCWLRLRA